MKLAALALVLAALLCQASYAQDMHRVHLPLVVKGEQWSLEGDKRTVSAVTVGER